MNFFWFKWGFLPLSCCKATGTLLPIKGNLQEIRNWCLISFLCMDYKILSKALVNRTEARSRSSTRTLYCRSTVDRIILIWAILGICTGLISLDQEKAFDSVVSLDIYREVWFQGFIAMMQVLYIDNESILRFIESLYDYLERIKKSGRDLHSWVWLLHSPWKSFSVKFTL